MAAAFKSLTSGDTYAQNPVTLPCLKIARRTDPLPYTLAYKTSSFSNSVSGRLDPIPPDLMTQKLVDLATERMRELTSLPKLNQGTYSLLAEHLSERKKIFNRLSNFGNRFESLRLNACAYRLLPSNGCILIALPYSPAAAHLRANRFSVVIRTATHQLQCAAPMSLGGVSELVDLLTTIKGYRGYYPKA